MRSSDLLQIARDTARAERDAAIARAEAAERGRDEWRDRAKSKWLETDKYAARVEAAERAENEMASRLALWHEEAEAHIRALEETLRDVISYAEQLERLVYEPSDDGPHASMSRARDLVPQQGGAE